MFQVLVTLRLNMKVDLTPNTTIHSQYHLLSGDIQPHKALSHPSLLAFRLQPRLNLKEISDQAQNSLNIFHLLLSPTGCFAILLSFYLTPFR